MPMGELKASLESVKCKDVRTYVQSGNVVFRSAMKNKRNLSTRLLDAVEKDFSFRPRLTLMTADELRAAADCNPFPQGTDQPKTLHFFFLAESPAAPDIEGIENAATDSEAYRLANLVFYLWTPDGFGKSKLAASVQRRLGVPTTARNYSTVLQIIRMTETSENVGNR
ncbi:hypothetical protein K227x_39660 [Rubripirellula lacrimiformis]|uniref:DUF1697 domain-containing protein n=2 Tax=Rubripirellula lacrimiformis TaxID=1930273 RepID=A0A517NEL1_9BACT|nr:hypothetical protein K227x_39660 [Rubripirellula lacrimiformis]